jgi:hypothetical protein
MYMRERWKSVREGDCGVVTLLDNKRRAMRMKPEMGPSQIETSNRCACPCRLWQEKERNTMKLITEVKAIEASIKSIQTRGKSLAKDIHLVGVSCLAHIEKHGDITLLNRLVTALPGGWRSNAIKAWAEAFGKVNWDNKAKAFVYDKSKKSDIEGAIEVSPEDFRPETEYKPMDLAADIAKLIKKAEARLGSDNDNVPAELFKKLQELVA